MDKAEGRERIVIENVVPEIDSGEFPIKRAVGEKVVVTADIYADGHDLLSERLLWKEMLNSDAKIYGGSGYGNTGGVEATPIPFHGKYFSLSLVLPPLSIVYFKHTGHKT